MECWSTGFKPLGGLGDTLSAVANPQQIHWPLPTHQPKIWGKHWASMKYFKIARIMLCISSEIHWKIQVLCCQTGNNKQNHLSCLLFGVWIVACGSFGAWSQFFEITQVFWLNFMGFGSGHDWASILTLVSGQIFKELMWNLEPRATFSQISSVLSSLWVKFCSDRSLQFPLNSMSEICYHQSRPQGNKHCLTAYFGTRIWT